MDCENISGGAMKKSSEILRISILAGSIYFSLVALAHLSGFKIPGLFIYFELPSYAFQDKIIALFALGWAMFFYTAYKDPFKYIGLVKAIIIAGAAAIFILCDINLSTNFSSFDKSTSINIIWLQVALLFVYWLWLVAFYFKIKKES